MSFKIITDSCADLDTSIRNKYGIDYAKMSITVEDKTLNASLDWDEYSPKQLYDYMRNGIRVYTAQVSRQEFERVFDNACINGEDVIYIGCSSALSASVNLAKVIAEEFKSKYPERTVYVIDSLNSCLGEGLMAVMASEMKNDGKSAKEIVDYIEENKLRVHQFCTVDSLKYLKNAGRVKASSAFFGDLMGVKPIIISDAKGNNFAVKKVRGRKNSIREIINAISVYGEDIENQVLYVSHADDIETATQMKNTILSEIKCKDVYVNYIGPIVGASAGPGTVAVYFVGKKVEIIGE